MLDKAISIAAQVFEGEFDKGGNPYILHCLWVMDRVRHLGHDHMIVAVLHDLIEDTSWTCEDLIDYGFSNEVVDAIEALTKDSLETYGNYMMRVKLNPIACEVKLRDLEHNSKITRLKGLREKDFDRLIKYNKAYRFLKD